MILPAIALLRTPLCLSKLCPAHWPGCCACPLVMAFDPGCLAEIGHLTGASTLCLRQRAHDAERTATMQAPAELTEWLRDYGFHREAVAAVESMAFTVEPTLAITQANVDALQSVLRMDDAQVKLVRAFVAAAAYCSRTSCLHVHAPKRYVCASLELLYHRLPKHSPSQLAMNATAGAHNDASQHSSGLLCVCVCFACLSSSTRMHVCDSHVSTVVQVLRAFKRLLCSTNANESMQRDLFCASPQHFLERLNMLVTTMAPRGFTAAALGVLAARDVLVLLRDPDWLAVQFEMLRAFFAPYSDAPATVTTMTRGLRASLPAVMPSAKQTLDKRFAAGQQMDLSSVHRAMLAGPHHVLEWTREGLKQHMRTLVAAGLFHSDAEARRECMQRPQLLRSHKLRWYVVRKAAVLVAGGSMDDVLAACCYGGSLQAAYA